MELGCWDKAMLKSIGWVGAAFFVYGALTLDAFSSLNSAYGFLAFAGIFSAVYILLSVLGWLAVGLPSHWVICKYTSGGYRYYVVVAILFFAGVLIFSNLQAAAFWGLVALVQALVFRFYLTGKSHNQ
ncbi:hypothetical protein MspRI1_19630 [Marinobacter sp. RI1]